MENWSRPTQVAGSFYPADRGELLEVLGGLLPESGAPEQVLGLIAPHAGYVYSGRIAGEVYARSIVPDTVVVLCPNHTGLGSQIAVWGKGSWKTPLGDIPVNTELASRLLAHPEFRANRDAHFAEHAIETQLPFLKVRNPKVQIVPIVLGRLDWSQCLRLGTLLAQEWEGTDALLVASTDMSHYVSAGEAKAKDDLALKRVASLDGKGLVDVVRREQISMCGYIPTAVVLEACRLRGAKQGEVVAYGHSGEVLGSDEQVVAYAGALVR